MIVDLSLKRCRRTSSQDVKSLTGDGDRHSLVDRISSLPDLLLSNILSLLPTKDAAAVGVLSKTMRHAFTWVTSLDLEDSPISHCSQLSQPNLLERTCMFKRFVDSVLQSLQYPYLSRFRLQFGTKRRGSVRERRKCKCQEAGCFPYLEPERLNAWICYPLSRSGGRLRELDLTIHLRNPGMLPKAVFSCESLEVLKLDVCLYLDQVCTMPSFCLPNLKVFHLSSATIPEDDFLTRLLSCCPLLEDLTLNHCLWKHGDCITLSSPSLRRLHFHINPCEELKCATTLHINTPNLQYFLYYGHIPLQHNVTYMGALVEATICFMDGWTGVSFPSMLSLLRKMYNVEHLSLGPLCIEALDAGELNDELPVFHNLTFLELSNSYSNRWDTILSEFLRCSPRLETLVFPEGLCDNIYPFDQSYAETVELERQCWRTLDAIPCRSHLKRIVIHQYWGGERELDMVKFLLRNTFVLEELVVRRDHQGASEDQMLLQASLNEAVRASSSCLIQVE